MRLMLFISYEILDIHGKVIGRGDNALQIVLLDFEDWNSSIDQLRTAILNENKSKSNFASYINIISMAIQEWKGN